MSAWVPLLAAILTAPITLLAVWFGSWLTRGNQQQQWIREQRLKVYVDILECCHLLTLASDKVRQSIKADNEDREILINTLSERSSDINTIDARIVLLLSGNVRKSANELVIYCGKVISSASGNDPPIMHREWRNLRFHKYWDLRHKFVSYAHVDLGIEQPKKTNAIWKRLTWKKR